MPAENFQHEGLAKNPDLELAQLKFLLSSEQHKNDTEIKQKLIDAIKSNGIYSFILNRKTVKQKFEIIFLQLLDMSPFYEEVCKDLGWTIDSKLLATMKEHNEAQLKELDAAIEDAEQNLGEMEVRESNLKKAEYLCRIGSKEASLLAFRKTYDKTVSLGHRLDIIFHNIRIGLFYIDHDLVTKNIEKAKTLIEEGGDWDRRNRLKVYQGLYCMVIRDFKEASGYFLDTVSTFTSYELMEYSTFVRYCVYMGIIALPRNQLRDKVITIPRLSTKLSVIQTYYLQIVKGSEILEVLHSLPDVKDFLFSLYNCQYADFFVNLAKVEQLMKEDRYMSAHYRYYVREMRILGYTQLLESYQSLTLTYMAQAFGVTEEYIDKYQTFIFFIFLNVKVFYI